MQLLIVGAVFESTYIPLLSFHTIVLLRTVAAVVAELNPMPFSLPYIQQFLMVGGAEDQERIPSPQFRQIILFLISGEPEMQYIPCELLSSMIHLDMTGLDELLQDMP
jgi:hypothetical protein